MSAVRSRMYLVLLAQERVDFRIPELESIADLCGRQLKDIWDKRFLCGEGNSDGERENEVKSSGPTTHDEASAPFLILRHVEEIDVMKMMSRSIFAKTAYEIWGYGLNYHDLGQSISRYPVENKRKYFSKDTSFCIRVKSPGRKVSLKEQVEKIQSLENSVQFEGPVNLENPTNEFHIIEDHGKFTGKKSQAPEYVYFGRLLVGGQRSLIGSYSVKKRKFIGNTSMEAGLSFVMSNLAKVKSGDYVCDPFVGTGSLLIAAAHFGGYVTGGDINYNILHSRGKSSRVGAAYREKDETIYNSLCQYGLGDKFVDVILHDAARNPWNYNGQSGGLFDAIITDPPYGIREGCRKIGTDKEDLPDFSEFKIHHPQRTAYHLNHVYSDLLQFAACTLVPGGRLVFWIPIYKPDYCAEQIPSHPFFKLLYNCEQPLKRETSRRLIVMEKLSDVKSEHMEKVSVGMFQGHNAFRDKYFKIGSEE